MTPRPTCAVFIATSLDGYIARSGGGLDWLKQVEQEGEDYGYAAFAASVDALILGRKTYDTVLGFGAWPYEGKRVAVLTRRPPAPRFGEEFLSGTPAEILAKLAGVRRAYVDGGDVIGQFLSAGLIDELTISTVPILLGAGIPLFRGNGLERRLVLQRSRRWPSGLVQSTYLAAGAAGVARA
jgi:dihydrofolate reductase